jgi:putative ABC transport system permease protein
VHTLFTDLRYAIRRLSKSPSFTVSSIVILALGIGAVTAVFSIVESVILRPYPFRDPGQLVVWHESMQEVSNRYPFIPDNYRHYLNLKAHSTKVADAALFLDSSFAVSLAKGHPEIVKGLSVSPNFFSVLGVSPVAGRSFYAEEAEKGANQGVILSWAAWWRFFNGSPSAIGSSLNVGGERRIVEGVLPKNFVFPFIAAMPDAPRPAEAQPYDIFQPLVPQGEDLTSDDGDFAFLVVARLKPGVTATEAASELDSMQKSYSAVNKLSIHLGARVEPLSREATGDVSKALWLLLASVLGVLLIACANLASLQSARSVSRDRENALRAALGAGPRRLFLSSLTESLLLSLVGGIAGIFVAFVGVRLFVAFAPANLPRLGEAHVSWPVLLFALGVSLLTAVIFGVVPSLRSLRSDPQLALQSGSPRSAGSRDVAGMMRLLVAIEVACTVVLLILTALVSRSFARVLDQGRTLHSDHLLIAEVNLLAPRYNQGGNSGEPARAAFVDGALARIGATAGVQVAAITDNMPFTGETNIHSVYRPDHPLPESAVPNANLRNVTPDYFAAMRIPLLAGENFSEKEREHPDDAIISQKLAASAWPGENPLGHKCRVNGVVADAHIVGLKQNPPVVYLPYWHDPAPNLFFLVRSSLALEALGPTVRRELWDIDPEVAIPVVKLLDSQLSESVATERFQALVLSCFGLAALLLAALGVYGVLAYSVSLRMREFGIRVALGSSRRALIQLVLGEVLYPVLAGVVFGVVAALAATRVIQSILFETRAADPLAISASTALLICTALAAALLPAYRASNADPMRVLRQE